MIDQETQQKFILRRAEGATFARLTKELSVAHGTLVNWSRKFQFPPNRTVTGTESHSVMFHGLAC